MNEELMKKLVEALKSRGMTDEDIESVKLELTEKTEDKKTPEEPKGDDVPTPPTEKSKVEEEAKVEEKNEPAKTDETDTKVEEEVKKEEEQKGDDVPPTEKPKEEPKLAEDGNKLPDGVIEFDPENPVVPEPPAPEVPTTPDYEAQYNEMKSLLEEERKAREGLQLRLEDALKALEESGIIRSSGKPASNIGVDDPTRVDGLHEQETTMGDVLKDINKY